MRHFFITGMTTSSRWMRGSYTPPTAMKTALRRNSGTWKPGIWKLRSTLCSDLIAWFGAASNPASLTSR
ncbi:Uncharacterised protein [Mycobacterium tuberculosis]|nr:Uncharacterised protein [Mycobacterium tuberculosis]